MSSVIYVMQKRVSATGEQPSAHLDVPIIKFNADVLRTLPRETVLTFSLEMFNEERKVVLQEY